MFYNPLYKQNYNSLYNKQDNNLNNQPAKPQQVCEKEELLSQDNEPDCPPEKKKTLNIFGFDLGFNIEFDDIIIILLIIFLIAEQCDDIMLYVILGLLLITRKILS